jgi:ubiquinone/menaquinone biosynthesis C-methylase UbiE
MNLDDVQRAAQEQFGRQSSRYGHGHILEQIDDVRAAMAAIALPGRAKVLDLATGAGHTGLYLAALGHDVTLADIAAPMLERASAMARERGLNITTRLHAAEECPYPNESFDLVTCRVAAHHFSSPEKFVAEAARILKMGGHFLLIDGTVQDGEKEAEEWAHAVEVLRDPSHHRFVTPDSWKSFCMRNGLEVVSCNWTPFKQPDLNWYFDTADTSPENRRQVLQLVAEAPPSARALFNLGEEGGKIIWWWQRLTLVAQKSRTGGESAQG